MTMIYKYNVYDVYVMEQLIGTTMPPIDLGDNKGYIVSHSMKMISNKCDNLEKLIREEFRYCFNKDYCTQLLLVLLDDIEITTEPIDDYTIIDSFILTDKVIPSRITEPTSNKKNKAPKPLIKKKPSYRVSYENKSIVIHYNTKNSIDDVYNNYGCYAIVNETLKTIYIGETIKSFHERWNSHYYNNMTNKKRELLYHTDTYFMIVEISLGTKSDTEELEKRTIEHYRDVYPDWTIIGGTYKNKNAQK